MVKFRKTRHDDAAVGGRGVRQISLFGQKMTWANVDLLAQHFILRFLLKEVRKENVPKRSCGCSTDAVNSAFDNRTL